MRIARWEEFFPKVGYVMSLGPVAPNTRFHPNFPAQFGQIADYLTRRLGWQITFVTSVATAHLQLPFTRISYQVREGPLPEVFDESYTLSSLMDHMVAIYRGLRGAPQFKPDLVVGHALLLLLQFLSQQVCLPRRGLFDFLRQLA